MIIQLCLLVVIGLGHCQDEVPSRLQIETSINRTIEEVERMIRDDPKLPRLSRTEIVDILFNITSKDVHSYGDKEDIDKARMEYQRALMVVLPYSPNSGHDDLKDLYTKPPMVQMISDSGETGNIGMAYEDDEEIEEMVYPSEEPRKSNEEFDTFSNNFVISEDAEESNSEKDDAEESTGSYENHRDTYSEVIDPIDYKTFASVTSVRPIYDGKPRVVYAEAPERFSFDLNNLKMREKSTPEPIDSTSEIPAEYEDSLSTDSKLQIVYSTTVNTGRPLTTKFITKTGQELNTEPTTISQGTTHRHVLTSDQWHYNAPPQTTTETPKKVYPEYKFNTERPSQENVKPQEQYNSVIPSSSTTRRPEVTIKIQGQNSEKKHQNGMQYFKVDDASPVYVTPMSNNTKNLVRNKFSSSYAANGGGIPKVSATMPPMRSEMKDLLASIGLSESNPDKQQQVGSNLPIPGSSDLSHVQVSALEATGVDTPSILSQNTFGSVNYDYKKGTQNLTPDMQLLFQAFGLQNSKESATPSTTTKRPTPVVVNLNSYSSFKPLPTTDVDNQDMRNFLAKFGLGSNESEKTRGHKSIKTRKNAEINPPSLIEAVPDSMKKILENIGLISRSQKSVEDKLSTTFFTETTTPKLHVFKPHETPLHTEEQKEKINKLLDTVRKVQMGRANSQDVQIAAKELLETTKTLQTGPDPLSLEEILNIYNEGIKNEVKRQEDVSTTPSEDSTDTATPLATETTTTTTTTTTTEPTTTTTMTMMTSMETAASEATNLDALADSFGGSTSAPDPVLPMQRRSGLYFLVDWNTFLEVGEEGPDRINLRFQPKVGDRTRFIPVTVP